MHSSMEFRDTPAQKTQDVRDLFKRADARHVSWITGTEAGEEPLRSIIADTGKAHGWRMHSWRDNWIVVKNTFVTAGTWQKGSVLVADKDETWGRGHDSGFPWVTFVHSQVGPVAVAAGHYPVKGANPGDPNYAINRRYAKFLADWAKKYGVGSRSVFYGGDQNVNDRTNDTFYGGPFTSAGDELHRTENTGHGAIDVIASYNYDRNVKAAYWRVLTDAEFPQYGDHFPCEAGFDVTV